MAKIRLSISNSSKLLAIAIKTIFESNFFLRKHYIPDVDRGRDGLREYCRILCIFSAIILDYTVQSSKWHCIIIACLQPSKCFSERVKVEGNMITFFLVGFVLASYSTNPVDASYFQEPFMITYMLLVVASYRTMHAHVYMCSASVFLLWSEYVRFWYEPGFISLRMRGNAKRDEDVSNSQRSFFPFFPKKTFICPSYFHLAYVTIRTRQTYIYVKWQEDRTSTTVHQIRFHFFHSF